MHHIPLPPPPPCAVGDEITPNPEALRFTFNPAEPGRKKKQKEEPTFYRDQVSTVLHSLTHALVCATLLYIPECLGKSFMVVIFVTPADKKNNSDVSASYESLHQ